MMIFYFEFHHKREYFFFVKNHTYSNVSTLVVLVIESFL